MFELNLASLPNYVLYLEGVQLSYIKVFVHIFSLWNSHKPCYITNAEFAHRTDLHRDTVINAIQFFEKHNILRRIQKGTKRYLIQVPKEIETDLLAPCNASETSTNVAQGSELDRQGVGVRPFKGSELDHHNIKYNNKRERERGETLSDDFKPDEETKEKVMSLHELSDTDLNLEHIKFIEYYCNKNTTSSNWNVEYRRWMINAAQFKTKKRKSS